MTVTRESTPDELLKIIHDLSLTGGRLADAVEACASEHLEDAENSRLALDHIRMVRHLDSADELKKLVAAFDEINDPLTGLHVEEAPDADTDWFKHCTEILDDLTAQLNGSKNPPASNDARNITVGKMLFTQPEGFDKVIGDLFRAARKFNALDDKVPTFPPVDMKKFERATNDFIAKAEKTLARWLK